MDRRHFLLDGREFLRVSALAGAATLRVDSESGGGGIMDLETAGTRLVLVVLGLVVAPSARSRPPSHKGGRKGGALGTSALVVDSR